MADNRETVPNFQLADEAASDATGHFFDCPCTLCNRARQAEIDRQHDTADLSYLEPYGVNA